MIRRCCEGAISVNGKQAGAGANVLKENYHQTSIVFKSQLVQRVSTMCVQWSLPGIFGNLLHLNELEGLRNDKSKLSLK